MFVSLFALSSEIDSDFDLLLSDLESTWPWKHCAKIPLEKIDKKISCDFFDSDAWCTFWRSLHVLLSLVGNGLGSEVCSNLILDLVQIYQISWCNFPIIRDMHMSRFAQDDQFSLKHPLSSTCYFEEFLSTIEHVAGPRPLQSFVGNLHGSLPSRWRLRSFIQRVLAPRCFVWILGTVKLQKFTFRKLNWKLKKCLPPFQFPHEKKKYVSNTSVWLGVASGVRGVSGVSASCLSQLESFFNETRKPGKNQQKKWNIPNILGDHQ